MVIPKINSAHGPETRNIINRAIDLINAQGKSIQDLVAEGQLTPSQYASLIQTVNGLIAKGEITTADIDKNNFKIDQTMLTNELLKQIAGTANINAVPADGSLTTIKYVDKSVTPEKTDFFNISANKFNPDKAINNKSIDSAGNVVDDSYYWLSDYIEYSDALGLSITTGSYRLATYDENKVFKLRGGITNANLIDAYGSDTKFIRISGARVKESVMLNDGRTLKPFVPYMKVIKKEHMSDFDFNDIENVSVHPSQTVHFRNSKNLYNRFDLEKGKSLGPYGDIINEETRYLTKPILLDGNQTLSFRYENGFRYGIYTEDGTMINRANKLQNQNLKINLADLNSPHYMLISPVEHIKDDIMINYGENSLPYEDYGYKLVSTPQVPITIDNSIIPEGSGSGGGSGGGGSTTPSIAGSTQIFESIGGNYASNVLTEVYDTTNASEIDYIELTTNSILIELIITYKDESNAEKKYKIINSNNQTELPQTIKNIVEHGGINVEFMQYDEILNAYKVAIKNLKFSNGFKLEVRNTDTSNKNIALQMAGRYYV